MLAALLTLPAFSATFYVDFEAGNDANDGLSKSTPFRTIPGTYRRDGSGYLRTSWGTINSSAKVDDNTTFNIKRGTTHSSATGGYVWLGTGSSGFYKIGCTNLVIQADPSWGTGTTATLDGAGMTIGIALFLLQIDGLTIRGLEFHNSPMEGLQAKEKAGNSATLTNLVLDGLKFFNNGTSFQNDLAGSGSGQLNIRKAFGVTVTNCVLNGDNNFINGILLGDNHKVVAGLIIDCTATHHQGDLVDNDSGIGFKCLNGQLTFMNCVAAWNLKGFDCGEQSGHDAGPGGSPVNIMYKVISSTSRSNYWGINFNGSADFYPGTITFYVVNNLVTDNGIAGVNTYSAPHNLHVVHNIFENNGAQATVRNGAHFITTPDTTTDLAPIRTYLFNNVFRGQMGTSSTLLNKYHSSNNDFTLTSDYNSYQQSGSEPFCVWSYYYGPASKTFNFGSDGPGRTSGSWYSEYANNTVPPAKGTGHHQCDVNSKGTGCSDPSLPSLSANYRPMIAYPGMDLSTQPWYIAEMGLDRDGRRRVGWDIGAHEYSREGVPVPPLGLRKLP